MERSKRERKLVALILNDLEANVGPDEVRTMGEDAADLSDEDLHATLKSRLGLEADASDEEMDDALAFVEEPEVLSEGGISGPGTAPDLAHNEDAKN